MLVLHANNNLIGSAPTNSLTTAKGYMTRNQVGGGAVALSQASKVNWSNFALRPSENSTPIIPRSPSFASSGVRTFA